MYMYGVRPHNNMIIDQTIYTWLSRADDGDRDQEQEEAMPTVQDVDAALRGKLLPLNSRWLTTVHLKIIADT